MSRSILRVRPLLLAAAIAAIVLATAAGAGARSAAGGNSFRVTNLVSDQAGVAAHLDPHLVNAWGLAALAASPWWVADNGTDVATLYDATGTPVPAASPLVVPVPSAPTGLVASGDTAFPVGAGAQAGPARFVFATEEGKILAWHPGLPAAIVVVDRSGDGAIFKGLATANDRLYVTDFHNRQVDIFDGGYNELDIPFHFVDPTLPPTYAPFGIQAIGDKVFVTFAKPDRDGEDDVHCLGCGYVSEFDVNGAFIARVASNGSLNAPWGLAMAPTGFGRFAGKLLVGNFGNGKIHAFKMDASDPTMWTPAGHLNMPDGTPVQIDGLWALEFGLGGPSNGPATTLFFTAGPDDESHGLFGTIAFSHA